MLNGGAGADSMSGGDGNDTYYVDNVDDSVIETLGASGARRDRQCTAVWRLHPSSANVENLYIDSTGAANGTGIALDNTLFRRSGQQCAGRARG